MELEKLDLLYVSIQSLAQWILAAIFLFRWCYCYIINLEILFIWWRWVLEYAADEWLIVLHVYFASKNVIMIIMQTYWWAYDASTESQEFWTQQLGICIFCGKWLTCFLQGPWVMPYSNDKRLVSFSVVSWYCIIPGVGWKFGLWLPS